jgi:hypothetical protein
MTFIRIFVSLLSLAALSAAAEEKPFTLAVVPSRSQEREQSISKADDKPDRFYVVLTNTSNTAQPIWETWNSWGYQTISFEITTKDGVKHLVSVREHAFRKNFPSVVLIPAGERKVFPITLDRQWESQPKIPKADPAPITLKAIYEVPNEKEAPQFKVWTGRIESKEYQFTLYQR